MLCYVKCYYAMLCHVTRHARRGGGPACGARAHCLRTRRWGAGIWFHSLCEYPSAINDLDTVQRDWRWCPGVHAARVGRQRRPRGFLFRYKDACLPRPPAPCAVSPPNVSIRARVRCVVVCLKRVPLKKKKLLLGFSLSDGTDRS